MLARVKSKTWLGDSGGFETELLYPGQRLEVLGEQSEYRVDVRVGNTLGWLFKSEIVPLSPLEQLAEVADDQFQVAEQVG